VRVPKLPPPVPKSELIRTRFRQQRVRDTAPELALRRELHSRGLRYRVDVAVLGGRKSRADIVFSRARVVVMVDGCFWHRCPDHGTAPRDNSEWWQQKLDANIERDRRTDAALAERGWRVVRVWEHEPPTQAADRIEALVRTGIPG
jgi:DNA mismatch endonuclease, patch repair protein